MNHQVEGCCGASPIVDSLRRLQSVVSKWRFDVGVSAVSPEWLRGTDFACARSGPFRYVLERIAERLRTTDRKTVEASFALRFGWSAVTAIGPSLFDECVLDIALENVSLKFRLDTSFERTAIHTPTGSLAENHPGVRHPLIRSVDDTGSLLRALRNQFQQQSLPVVEASWASRFINVCERLGGSLEC